MKIYIIYKYGDYSYVDSIFLKEKDAKEFVQVNEKYNICNCFYEEYDVNESFKYNIQKYIRVFYGFNLEDKEEEYFDIEEEYDIYNEKKNYKDFDDSFDWINIEYVIPVDKNLKINEELKQKHLKQCRSYVNKAKELYNKGIKITNDMIFTD